MIATIVKCDHFSFNMCTLRYKGWYQLIDCDGDSAEIVPHSAQKSKLPFSASVGTNGSRNMI